MKKYLIALDLDGTLLYDWNTLKQSTNDYISSVIKQGHSVVIATGRPYRSSERFYDALNLDTPLINYNGSLITAKHRDDFKPRVLTLSKDDVIKLFKETKPIVENAFCEIRDDIYLLNQSNDISDLLHFFNGARLFEGAFDETLVGDPNGCIVIAKKNRGYDFEAHIKNHYSEKMLARNWGDNYSSVIEVFNPKTNKGAALDYVAEYLGFSRENIIAFGDGHNDIEMLQYAGIGIAMANSHPELLDVADIISPYTNQEHAIEYHLDILLNKGGSD